MFLDHKTLEWDIYPFIFFIMCEVDDNGCHPVAYFSKEKKFIGYNLSCIMTFPWHQRKGYAKFLIALS